MNGCPFCGYAGPVLREFFFGEVLIIEPLRPVVPGHVLAVPAIHVADALDVPAVTGSVMAAAAQYAREAEVGACNLITSAGAAATQTVFHLHVHIVPRREGDGLALPWSGVDA